MGGGGRGGSRAEAGRKLDLQETAAGAQLSSTHREISPGMRDVRFVHSRRSDLGEGKVVAQFRIILTEGNFYFPSFASVCETHVLAHGCHRQREGEGRPRSQAACSQLVNDECSLRIDDVFFLEVWNCEV